MTIEIDSGINGIGGTPNLLGPQAYKGIEDAQVALTETITPNTTQLKALGFDVYHFDDYDEQVINQLNSNIINQVQNLMTRGVFGPQAKSDKKITVKRLQNIQSKFGILTYLHEKRLKMTPEILGTIKNIETNDIYDSQVENFVKYGIEVTNANDLTKKARDNTQRQHIQGFSELGYSLNNMDFRRLNENSGITIDFKTLERLNNILKRKVSIGIVIEDDFRHGLTGCQKMDDFNWELVESLTQKGFVIPEEQLLNFKGEEIEKRFQPLIDNNIKILNDYNIFHKIIKGREISNEEFLTIYGWNHPDEDPQKYKTYIDENVHKKDYFLEAYKRTEEYMQSQNKSS